MNKLQLHGSILSNYHNVVKTILAEKGLPYREVPAEPSQDPAFLARSPMGKIPLLITPHGPISESQAIITYLEKVQPEPAFIPFDAFEAAKTQELLQTVTLYVDAPIRPLINMAFFAGRRDDDLISRAEQQLARGFRALEQLARFDPFLRGPARTVADLAAFFTLDLVDRTMVCLTGKSPVAGLTAYPAFHERMRARGPAGSIMAESRAAWQAFTRRA